ncbi:MAG TPA: hypothetical protein VJB60_02615 [Candidatus Peribacterales bacterium]|nr:hypothetical protein [Candidatus Peribacterales bacterium]
MLSPKTFSRVCAVLLSASLLTLLHLTVLRGNESRDVLDRGMILALPLSLSASTTEEQERSLVQALLALPHVRNVSFQQDSSGMPDHSRMQVTLRSLEDFDTVFAFLTRPELTSVLTTTALQDLPSARDEMLQRREKEEGSLRQIFAFSLLLILSLTLTITFFFLGREATLIPEIRLLRLFGAGKREELMPLLSEGAMLSLVSLLLSLPSTIIVILFLMPPTASFLVVCSLFLMEGALLLLLLLSVSYLFRSVLLPFRTL